MARFCLSVRPSVRPPARPSVRPFVRPTVHRSRMHKPGPVSADDRSHHRVLTAGPGAGEGSRLCGIISPKCDGLCRGGGTGRGGKGEGEGQRARPFLRSAATFPTPSRLWRPSEFSTPDVVCLKILKYLKILLPIFASSICIMSIPISPISFFPKVKFFPPPTPIEIRSYLLYLSFAQRLTENRASF